MGNPKQQLKVKATVETAAGPAAGVQLGGDVEPAVMSPADAPEGEVIFEPLDIDDDWEDRQPVEATEAPAPAPVEEPIDFGPEQVVPTAPGCERLRVPRFVAREIGERLGDRLVARYRISDNHKLVIVTTEPVTKFEVSIPLPLE